MKICFLLSITVGCAAGGSHRPLVVDPDPDVKQQVQNAAERWYKAAGVYVVVAKGGLPITLDDAPLCRAFSGPSVRAAACTDPGNRTVIQRSVLGQPGITTVVAHEMAHLFGVTGHVQEDTNALMYIKSNNVHKSISEQDLDLVCSLVECSAFNPE